MSNIYIIILDINVYHWKKRRYSFATKCGILPEYFMLTHIFMDPEPIKLVLKIGHPTFGGSWTHDKLNIFICNKQKYLLDHLDFANIKL